VTGEQPAEPVTSVCVPTAQPEQDEAPAAEYVPVAQLAQAVGPVVAVEAAEEYDPALQVMHWDPPAVLL